MLSHFIFDSSLVRLLRRCNNGKAGGPSGWNGAMLCVLADSPTCMEGIRFLLQDITTGRIPPAVRPHITATRLIALAKPNGAPRPIAMGELFYRVAAVYAVRSVSDVARQLLAPHQYGVGVPGGCEHIVHCMQHSLSDSADNGPLAAVKVDISNAFNTCSRSRLLHLLFATPELAPLHRFVHWAYSEPTLLIPQRRGKLDEADFIQSASGVRQGDPLSSLLFCVYMKTAIDAVMRDPELAGRIQVYAYVDDVHIVGAVEDVLAAHTQLIEYLSNISLTVNPDKCSLIYSSTDSPAHHCAVTGGHGGGPAVDAGLLRLGRRTGCCHWYQCGGYSGTAQRQARRNGGHVWCIHPACAVRWLCGTGSDATACPLSRPSGVPTTLPPSRSTTTCRGRVG